jgi:C-terminal processing protease CtpA/Prc
MAFALALGGKLYGSETAPGEDTHGVAGIGIVAASDGASSGSRIQDHIVVSRVLPGGPAARAKLQAGDEIVEIDGKKVAGMGLHHAVSTLLRGPLGSVVKITVVRPGDTERHAYDLVRDVVPTPSQ